MGRWIKKHKGLFIFLCILLTLIILIGGVVACSVNMSKKYLETLMSNETAVVERRDLVEAISASGTIVSSDSVMVTARVSGVDVNEMYVELGDWVEAGTLICTLDTTKIEENLAIAEANLAANEQSLAMAVDAAQRNYNDAVNSQNQANANAQTSVAEAERALASARESYNAANAAYNNTCNECNPIITALGKVISYNAPYDSEKSIKKSISDVENEIHVLDETNNNKELVEGDEGYDVYASKRAELTDKKNNLETKLSEEETNNAPTKLANEYDRQNYIDIIKAKYPTLDCDNTADLTNTKAGLESQINSARLQRDSAQNARTSAQTAYDNAVANASTPSGTSTVAAARDSLTSAQTNAEIGTLSAEQQVNSYYDQIADCTVYAPISGLVTSVNCKAGDIYSGAAIITIENTSVYDVETYISEYDIGKIKVGQEVVIKTNGTGDLELDGIVKSIAPRATVSANGVTYKVVVQINTECDGLRLDMTAKLSIILNKAENVVTVPYESVQYEEDGRAYVEISKGKDEATGITLKEKVYVTTGVESAYYVEITTGAISEGSEVIVPRDEYSAIDIYALLEEEGALGGY